MVNVEGVAEQIANVYRDKLAQAGYDKNGELYNFTFEVEYEGLLFHLYFNLPDYWIYAEKGRGPGKFPPPDAIRQWLTAKRFTPVPGTNGKVPSTEQMVYLVSRKIAREGTTGKPLLEQTIKETENLLIDTILKYIDEQVKKELKENDIEL